MKTFNLSLSLDEVNFILESLGKRSYIKVHQLIEKIKQQADAQLGDVERVVAIEEAAGQ